jgi:mono/diheme cytochrome c family protein
MVLRGALIGLLAMSIAFVLAGQKNESDNKAEENFLAHNDVVSGGELYRMYCATCHGVDGRGDGPVAEALKQRPPDLTAISKRNGGTFPGFRIEHIIDGYEVKYAHGTRDMPVWGDFFHDMKRDDVQLKLREHNLTEYIRSLQR